MPNFNINNKVIYNKFQLQSETLQWIQSCPNPVCATVILCVNQFILQCKNDDNWQYLDRFWLFAQCDQTNARVSIKNPTSTAITEVNSPTWTQFQGYDFNGTTQYLRTAFIPSLDGVNYTLNSASFGVYSRDDYNGGFAWDIGGYDAVNGSALSLRDGANSSYAKINSVIVAIITAGGVTDSRGLFVSTRTASNAIAIFRNGSNIGTDTDASSALPATEMYVGALNNNGVAANFSQRQISISFVASGLVNQLSFYNAIQTLAYQLKFNV